MQRDFEFLSEEVHQVAAGNGWSEHFMPSGDRILERAEPAVLSVPVQEQPLQ